MAKILLPPKSGAPKECGGRAPPALKGSYYEFDLTQEEFSYWKDLSSSEREKLRDAAWERCFYDALHDLMKVRPKRTSSWFGHST
jgi:hypothetical protein